MEVRYWAVEGLRVLDDAFNRVVCELVELLSLGETSLCTLVQQDLPGQRLTLNLSSAHLRTLGVVFRPWSRQ